MLQNLITNNLYIQPSHLRTLLYVWGNEHKWGSSTMSIRRDSGYQHGESTRWANPGLTCTHFPSPHEFAGLGMWLYTGHMRQLKNPLKGRYTVTVKSPCRGRELPGRGWIANDRRQCKGNLIIRNIPQKVNEATNATWTRSQVCDQKVTRTFSCGILRTIKALPAIDHHIIFYILSILK